MLGVRHTLGVLILSVVTCGCVGTTWSEAIGPRVTVRASLEPEELAVITGEVEQMIDALEAVAFEFVERPSDHFGVILFTRASDYELGASRSSDSHLIEDIAPGAELPANVFVRGEWDNHRRRVVRHMLAHRYVHFYYPGAPAWLDEGLCTFFSMMVVKDGRITLGEAFESSVPRSRMPAFDVLLKMSPSEFALANSKMYDRDISLAVGANYQAAWMAVHFLMTAGGDWRRRFDAYLLALSQGEQAQAAWDAAFAGVTAADLERDTLAHHSYARIPTLRTAVQLPKPPHLTARRLRDAEVDVLHAWYREWDGAGVVKARAEIERALRAEPSYADAHLWRGHLARNGQQYAEARSSFQEARRCDPRSTAALVAELDLALDDVQTGRRPESQALIDADTVELAKMARTPLALDTLARALAQRGRMAAALGFAVRATSAALGCASCWATRAELSWGLSKVDMALASIDMAIRQSKSSDLRAHYEHRRHEMVNGADAQRAKVPIEP